MEYAHLGQSLISFQTHPTHEKKRGDAHLLQHTYFRRPTVGTSLATAKDLEGRVRLGRGRRRRSLDLQDSSESGIDGEAIGDAMKLCPSRKRPTYGGLNSEKHGAWEARTKSRRAPMLRASHAYRADSVCGGCNRRANPAPTAPGYEGFWNCKHIASCGSLVVIYQLCRLRSPRVHRIHSIPLVKHTYVTATLRGADWVCSIYRSGRAPQQARGGGGRLR